MFLTLPYHGCRGGGHYWRTPPHMHHIPSLVSVLPSMRKTNQPCGDLGLVRSPAPFSVGRHFEIVEPDPPSCPTTWLSALRKFRDIRFIGSPTLTIIYSCRCIPSVRRTSHMLDKHATRSHNSLSVDQGYMPLAVSIP